MSNEPARIAYEGNDHDASMPLYDHEADGSPSRRRPVADWGGDELFTHVPRRRLNRPPAVGHPRRPGGAASPTHLRRVDDAAEPLIDVDQLSSAGLAGVQAGEPAERPRLRLAPVEEAPAHGDSELPPLPALPPGAIVGEPLPEPAPLVAVESVRRSRGVHEHVGARPDRLAAWAFLLGMLLVLIAVATADASVIEAL